ncbi:hypothetical protein, partial [Pedobacter faecalis]|uniref:hypothetical protein n=1 Tax=Pedobacter faecalis TaxID=3041495 RepID=UPI00254C8455
KVFFSCLKVLKPFLTRSADILLNLSITEASLSQPLPPKRSAKVEKNPLPPKQISLLLVYPV